MSAWRHTWRGGAAGAAAALLALGLPTTAIAVSPQPGTAPPRPPLVLPGDAAAARVAKAAGTWIVGARPSVATARVARRLGATRLLAGTGVYRVRRPRARSFAGALRARRLLTFAEPDRLSSRRQAFPSDPYTPNQWALPAVGATSVAPPPVTPTSPTLGILEDEIALDHPEFAGAPITAIGAPRRGEHGTAVTSVAAAPANGVGIVGVWPGMNVLISAAADGSCGAAVEAIGAALARGVAVMNMSYGFDGGCFAHRVATNEAFGRGVVSVAAAGNEFEEGNPSDQSPSADPHIVTVAALAEDLSSAPFSNEHDGIDLSAPGINVLAAVPPEVDNDGTLDGYLAENGTSFSSPIVAAATAWVRTVRPDLDHTQLMDLIRYSARDLGDPGWEQRFGFGILDIPAALTNRAPASDPLEVNDDVEWVDGTHFGGADRPVYRGRRSRLSARLDRLEDPVDVYRVLVPARTALRVSVDPRFGDPDLELYSRRSRTVYGRRGRFAASRLGPRAVDRVVVGNRSFARRLAYVVVYSASLDAGYRLTLRRARLASARVRVP